MATYYFGQPLLTADGDGTSQDPWNQYGFEHTATVFTSLDQLEVAAGYVASIAAAIGNSLGSIIGDIALTDTSVDASELNSLNTKTSGVIDAASVDTLTGTAAAIDTAINASSIDIDAAVAVNVTSGSATVAQANSIDAQTTGVVTATISDTAMSILSTLSGT
ncbi:MAG: hypothetical protein ACK55H_08885, partial [Cyanobacteriota bacterium]